MSPDRVHIACGSVFINMAESTASVALAALCLVLVALDTIVVDMVDKICFWGSRLRFEMLVSIYNGCVTSSILFLDQNCGELAINVNCFMVLQRKLQMSTMWCAP